MPCSGCYFGIAPALLHGTAGPLRHVIPPSDLEPPAPQRLYPGRRVRDAEAANGEGTCPQLGGEGGGGGAVGGEGAGAPFPKRLRGPRGGVGPRVLRYVPAAHLEM